MASYAEKLAERAMGHLRSGRLEEAAAAAGEWARLYPADVRAHNLRGVIAAERGRLQEAREALETSVRLMARNPEALTNLGIVYGRQERWEEAVGAYRRALAMEPGQPDTLSNLGIALAGQGKYEEAVEAYERALRSAPGTPAVLHNLAIALEESGRPEEAIEAGRRAVEAAPTSPRLHSNLLLMLTRSARHSPEEVATAHREFGRRYDRPRSEVNANERSVGRVLRVGYVSADFRSHAVASFLEPLLLHHDRGGFHIICYSGTGMPDAVTERMRRQVEEWRDIRTVADDAAAEMIRADGIDILVDLSGHTGGNRLPLLARRPAPVQVTYLGYPNTTGLASVDYRLTDAVADPVGMTEGLFTERLVRLPRAGWCYQPPGEAPEVSPLPAESGEGVTFASFHPTARLNEQVLGLWARVLAAAPRSRLLIVRDTLSGRVRRRLGEVLVRNGADEARVEIRGEMPAGGHLALYQEADMLLDTFPWSGHTTACQSLWMGAPVVTLAGRMHASRMVASVLSSVGLEELVATTAEEYVKIAAGLAEDRVRLGELRRTMRQRMRGSALLDGPGFARELERAYRAIWTAWCEGRQG